MCALCLKHGEGKKYYLKAENYPDDLPSCRFVCRRDAVKPLWRQTSGKIDRISIQQNFLTQGIEEELRPPHDGREAVWW